MVIKFVFNNCPTFHFYSINHLSNQRILSSIRFINIVILLGIHFFVQHFLSYYRDGIKDIISNLKKCSIFGSLFSHNFSCNILWLVWFLVLTSLFFWASHSYTNYFSFFPLLLSFLKSFLSTTPKVIFYNTGIIMNFSRLRSFSGPPTAHDKVTARVTGIQSPSWLGCF